MKIGGGGCNAPADYTLATSGTDYAIWTKTTSNVAPLLGVSLSGGTYFNEQTVTLSATDGASICHTAAIRPLPQARLCTRRR
ncbi:MAG: hypothetical protein U0Z17_05935 [Bacteroidales bacterium]